MPFYIIRGAPCFKYLESRYVKIKLCVMNRNIERGDSKVIALLFIVTRL